MRQRRHRVHSRLKTGLLRRCSRILAQGSPPRLIRLQGWLPTALLQALLPFWLFERSSRPAGRSDQILLLGWIRQLPCSTVAQRQYALVALAYRAVDAEDHALAGHCLLDLLSCLARAEATAADHRASPAVQPGAADPACSGPGEAREAELNRPIGGVPAAETPSGSPREHPFKWLLSLHTTLYHLGLVLDQRAATLERLARFCDSLVPERLEALDADVACRISSNLMRCLMLCWLQAWSERLPSRQKALQHRLEQLATALTTRHRHHPRQRFHLQSATVLLSALEELRHFDDHSRAAAGSVLLPLARELVRSPNPALPQRLCDWFSSPVAGSVQDVDQGSSGPFPRT